MVTLVDIADASLIFHNTMRDVGGHISTRLTKLPLTKLDNP